MSVTMNNLTAGAQSVNAAGQTVTSPVLGSGNITNHTGSTFAGISALALGASQMIATNGIPTTTPGWIVLALSLLGGLGGIFGR